MFVCQSGAVICWQYIIGPCQRMHAERLDIIMRKHRGTCQIYTCVSSESILFNCKPGRSSLQPPCMSHMAVLLTWPSVAAHAAPPAEVMWAPYRTEVVDAPDTSHVHSHRKRHLTRGCPGSSVLCCPFAAALASRSSHSL